MTRIQHIGRLDNVAKRITANSDENPYGTINANFQTDVDEYARSVAGMPRMIRRDDTGLHRYQFERAMLLTALYTKVDNDTYSNMMRRLANDAPFTRLRRLTNEDNPTQWETGNGASEKYYARIQHGIKKGLNMFGSFSRFTYAFRGTGSDPFWQFLRFIRFNKGEAYERFSPATSGGNIGDFPGPGLVFEKMDKPLFPKGRIAARFQTNNRLSHAEQKYRELLTKSESDLTKTKFGFFRGMYMISNKEKMKINNEPYDLLVLNDHLANPNQRAVYLIPSHMGDKFFRNPMKDYGSSHLLNPQNLNEYDCIIDITELSNLGGFDQALPNSVLNDLGISDEIRHPERKRNVCNKLHLEIENALLFGYAQFDLMNEAFNLHSLGYFFDSKQNTWMLDKYRLLREAVRWNQSNSNPILFPYPLEIHAIRPKLVKEIGFLDENLILYKTNPAGNHCFFENGKPEVGKEGDSVKDWIQLLGREGIDYWDFFHTDAAESGAFMAFTDNKMKQVGLDIIKEK